MGATEVRAYDPSRDIDFVVPKRLQEADILDILGTGIAEELLARRKAEEMSRRVDLPPYEWYSVPKTSPGIAVDSPFRLESTTEIPIASLPKRRGRPPKPESEKKLVVPGRGRGRPRNVNIVEEGDHDESSATLSVSDSLMESPDRHEDVSELNGNVEAARADLVSFSSPDQVAVDALGSTKNLEATKEPQAEPQEQQKTQGIITQVSSYTISDFTPDCTGSDSPQKHTPLEKRADLESAIAAKDLHDPETTVEDEELYQALGNTSPSSWTYRTEAQPELEQTPISGNIHILGMGTVGKFIAHTLAGLPNAPPITLLMHRPLLMQQWHEEGGAITLLKHGRVHIQSGFNIESSADFRRESPYQRFAGFGKDLEHTAEPPNTVIDTLIVTTNANTTTSALLAIKHRLRQSSTICFIQDGMGIVEKVNATVFPDSRRRPTYVLGNISHKLCSTVKTFTIIEKRPGTIACSKLPQVDTFQSTGDSPLIRRSDFSWTPQATHLIGTLARAREFNTETLGHKSFYRAQLESVAVNAVIGPLCVIFDCSNDQLLFNYSATQTMRALLKEISLILRSLPELRTLRNINEHFSERRLEAIVVSTIRKTGKNLSSMLQDVRAGKRTDVDFYNGYLVDRAAELGIDCPRNEMLLYAVKGKQMMKSREVDSYIPFRNEL